MNSCSDISICISISIDIYGWSKSSLGVSCKILWTNPNELFGQPYIYTHRGFPGGSVVKNSPANAGDMGLILSRKDLLEKEMTTYSNILAWRIAGTKEPGGLS